MKDENRTIEPPLDESIELHRRITELETNLRQALADQAAIATENARLRAETEQRIQRLAGMHKLDRAIATNLRITDIYYAFALHAAHLLPYCRTSITLLEGDRLRVAYVAGKNETKPVVGTLLSRQFSSISWVIAKGQPVLRHNIAAEAHSEEDDQLVSRDIQSSMIIPLRVKGQIIGTWNIGSRRVGAYSPDDLEVAQSMADQLALAVENARLYETVQQELNDRKRAEETLWKMAGRFRSLIENASDLVVILDTDGLFRYASPSSSRILGYGSEDLIGKKILELVHPKDVFLIEETIKQAFEHPGVGMPEIESRIQHQDGSWHIFAATITNLLDHSTVDGLLVNCHDITERKKLEEQFRQAQKMEAIGQLAGGVAHDFNNLLTAMMGYASFALEGLPSNSPIRSDIQGIQKTAQRAANLTGQLLAFARKQIVEPKILNLNDLILNMDKMLRRLIRKDIELVTLPASDLGLVKIDPSQFEQILVNLVVNARDAMPAGGKLIIETTNVTLDQAHARQQIDLEPGVYVMLVVSDEGVGMTEEVQAHLFEPFFTTKALGKGTGLGLATCFGIVKQSEGHILVESTLNQGTTFKIYLPRVEEPTSSLGKPDETDLSLRGTETILLVEDEIAVRHLVARTLHEQGYTVLEAANGSEALGLVQDQTETDIHLLLTDEVMPQMGGKALASQLRAVRPDLKVLFISGYTEETIIPHVLDPKTAFLGKPFTPTALAGKVREVLDLD